MYTITDIFSTLPNIFNIWKVLSVVWPDELPGTHRPVLQEFRNIEEERVEQDRGGQLPRLELIPGTQKNISAIKNIFRVYQVFSFFGGIIGSGSRIKLFNLSKWLWLMSETEFK